MFDLMFASTDPSIIPAVAVGLVAAVASNPVERARQLIAKFRRAVDRRDDYRRSMETASFVAGVTGGEGGQTDVEKSWESRQRDYESPVDVATRRLVRFLVRQTGTRLSRSLQERFEPQELNRKFPLSLRVDNLLVHVIWSDDRKPLDVTPIVIDLDDVPTLGSAPSSKPVVEPDDDEPNPVPVTKLPMEGDELSTHMLAILQRAADRFNETKRIWLAGFAVQTALPGGLPLETRCLWDAWNNELYSEHADAEAHLSFCILMATNVIARKEDMKDFELNWQPAAVDIDGTIYAAGPYDDDTTRPTVWVIDHFTCSDFIETDFAMDDDAVVDLVEAG